MTTVLPARAELCTGLSGSVSQRLHRLQMSAARRESIERRGAVPPTVSRWVSRDSWTANLRALEDSPAAFRAVCTALRVSMSVATFIAIGVVMAERADHSDGRNCAVTKEFIASRVGCSKETVKRAWRVLAALGWGIKAREGHGSRSTPSVGNRAAIWHLVSRPDRPAEPADSVENVPLPPSRRDRWVTPVEKRSPSVRARARAEDSSPKQTHQPRSRRRYRATPRPLAVQRLAAGLVTPAVGHGPDDEGRRTALIAGLERGHIGAICDAITTAGIDATAWTPKALKTAMDADMRARGWSWPDRIERPAAFLASRLRRLPARPDRSGSVDGGTAAGLEQPRRAPGELSAARLAPVQHTAPEPVQTAAGRAYARALFAEQRQHRQADSRPPRSVVVRVRQSAPHGPHGDPETATCATCGCADAPRRRFLPAARAHVCDECWDGAPDQARA